MSQNQHRWKESIDQNMCAVLNDAAARLKWAWNLDMEHPQSYPTNTNYAFGEIVRWIREAQRGDSKDGRRKPKLRDLLRGKEPPRCFSDLLDDRILKSLYEEQNTGSYEQALKCAASGDKSAHLVFNKILKLVDAAYVIAHFGEGLQPRPRIQFLHRNLLEISDLVQLTDLKDEGIVEFLDDLCPCGKVHAADAIRQLRKRRMRRPTTQHL